MAFLTFSLKLKQESFSTEINSFDQSESSAYSSLPLQNLRPRSSEFCWTSPAVRRQGFFKSHLHPRQIISLDPAIGTLSHNLAFSFIKHTGFWRYLIGNFFNISWRSLAYSESQWYGTSCSCICCLYSLSYWAQICQILSCPWIPVLLTRAPRIIPSQRATWLLRKRSYPPSLCSPHQSSSAPFHPIALLLMVGFRTWAQMLRKSGICVCQALHASMLPLLNQGIQ